MVCWRQPTKFLNGREAHAAHFESESLAAATDLRGGYLRKRCVTQSGGFKKYQCKWKGCDPKVSGSVRNGELLQEDGQTLPEAVIDEDKEHTTFFVTRVKHFQKSFLWPQVQECTAFRPQSFGKGAQRCMEGSRPFPPFRTRLIRGRKGAMIHVQIKHLYTNLTSHGMIVKVRDGSIPSCVAPSIPGVAGLQRS